MPPLNNEAMRKKQYHRELRWIEIKNCRAEEDYAIYGTVKRKDLDISVGKSGVIQPFTGIIKEGKTLILDGRERLKVAKEKFEEDYQVPVWVISETLTDSELKWLVLDLERTRKKTYLDLMSEFKLYNSLIPNRQGQRGVEKGRRQLICDLMGISTSQLKKLIKIDNINPSLLIAVENGVCTLETASRKADEIKRKSKLQPEMSQEENCEEEKKGRDRIYRDKEIDLNDLPDSCPSCNRRLDTIEYDDIQEIFNVNRKDDENQTDWLLNVA